MSGIQQLGPLTHVVPPKQTQNHPNLPYPPRGPTLPVRLGVEIFLPSPDAHPGFKTLRDIPVVVTSFSQKNHKTTILSSTKWRAKRALLKTIPAGPTIPSPPPDPLPPAPYCKLQTQGSNPNNPSHHQSTGQEPDRFSLTKP